MGAAVVVQPGIVNKYTTETLTSSTTAAADTFCFNANCEGFTVTVSHVSGTPDGAVNIQRDATGLGVFTNWASPIGVAVNGDSSSFDVTDGPFNAIFRFYGAISTGSVVMVVTAAGS